MKKIKDAEVRWGIIGVGDVCEVKSAPAMNLVENSKLVAVMRRNSEKARDYAARHHVPKWYDNADDLINDPDVNAIYIATPPNAHAEMTKKAAAAGKPVYVEKPMARNHQECLDMIKACEKANVPLYVAYYRRMLPNFLKIKELVESSAIGEVRMVNIQMYKPVEPDIVTHLANNWRVDPEIAGGGYFYDLASHQLDFLDYLFGPIAKVHGISANQAGKYKAEDIVTASFKFQSGVLGVGSWCFTSGNTSDVDITTIIGSMGQISFPYFGGSHIFLERDGQKIQRFDFQMPKHIQQPLIQTVVDDLLGQGNCPSMGESAARTNLVMEQMAQN